jgi:hypothetical protein
VGRYTEDIFMGGNSWYVLRVRIYPRAEQGWKVRWSHRAAGSKWWMEARTELMSIPVNTAGIDGSRSIYGINKGKTTGKAAAVGRYTEDIFMGGNSWSHRAAGSKWWMEARTELMSIPVNTAGTIGGRVRAERV